MTNLSYSGDPGKWKLDFLRNVREVYTSGLTLDHWIMHSAFKSFDGKNQQVQGMIVDDINGEVIQGSNTNFDGLSSRDSQFLATMGSGKPQRPALPGKPTPGKTGPKSGKPQKACTSLPWWWGQRRLLKVQQVRTQLQ